MNEHLALLERITTAATRWTRCCDLWCDGMGGMHCLECEQKTFAMLRTVQEIIGVDKELKAIQKKETTNYEN